MKSILVICCCRGKKAQTKLYESMAGFDRSEAKVIYHEDNTKGLPEVYNQYITSKTAKKHDIVLFVHDDVYIDDYKLKGKLYANMNMFDIVGLAGCIKPKIKSPCLWHLMSAEKNHRGSVYHPFQVDEDVYSIKNKTFGYTPARVAIIDGLFIAVNLKPVLEAGWKFNESYDFHHYDISSCIDANRLKLKIGVAPIHVIHSSLGLSNPNDLSWRRSEKTFLQQYGNGK